MNIIELAQETKRLAEKATPVVLDEEVYRVAYLNGGLGALVNEACCNYRGPNHGDFVKRVVDDVAGIVLRTAAPQLADAVIEMVAQRDEMVDTLNAIAAHCYCGDAPEHRPDCDAYVAECALTKLGLGTSQTEGE